jgi:hypothetical protein
MAWEKRHAPRLWTEKNKIERGNVTVKTRGNLTALGWKHRWDIYMLTNMDPPPPEGNFCENNRPAKPHIVARYNRHMGYIDNSDRMANTYSMCWHSFKWTTKLFFHLLDLTVLNSWILLSLCGAKYTHRYFRFLLVRNLIEEAGRSQDCPTPSLGGRPSAADTNVTRLEVRHSQHWPVKSNIVRCHVYSGRGQCKTTAYKWPRCNVGLCVVPCFGEYHTKVNLLK